MKKMRLSYTLLSLWDRGDIQAVVDTYFHLDRPVTGAMVRGREVHRELEDHIKAKGQFPKWFFEYELKDPEPEKDVVVNYNEMFDLKGIFDCVDDKILFEFKTGTSNSLTWARTWQLPIYFLIAELAEIEIEKAMLIRHNKQSDFVIVHNTKAKRDRARNIIDSVGPDIYHYFETEGLL